MKKDAELIVIGAGPAGMTAALYASRAGLDTLLLDGDAPGGKLLKTSRIDNWPGLPGENGADLALKMLEHATSFGARYEYGRVVAVQAGQYSEYKTAGRTAQQTDRHSGLESGQSAQQTDRSYGLESGPAATHSEPQTAGGFTVALADGKKLTAEAVIVATGTTERLLHIPGERENTGRGVAYCAVCDGAFHRGQTVAVIGAGNAALEEADYLTQFADKVFLVMRRDVFRADQIAVERVMKNPKIEILQKAVPVEITDDGSRVTGLRIRFSGTGQETLLKVSGVFPYIGANPASDFLKADELWNRAGIFSEQGYLSVGKNMRTSVPGLYGAGDVIDKPLRQLVTAVGDGAAAAQDAFRLLRSEGQKISETDA